MLLKKTGMVKSLKQDEFRTRYIIKVGSSILIMAFNMVVQLILPRAFSIDEYGIYTYNLNVFTSIVIMLNMSASNALSAKFAKRNDEIGLVIFYLKYYGLVSIVLSITIFILYPLKVFQETFAGQTLIIVFLGIETAIINKLLTDCVSIYDACAITRFPAVMQILLKGIISIVVIASYFLGKLSLLSFYIIQVLIVLVFTILMIVAIIIYQENKYVNRIDLGWRVYLKEYVIFCKPLVVATFVGQLVVIIMNGALMKWSGVVAQAMFGVAWQLNSLVGYVFSPYAELSKREFAVIYDNIEKLKEKFLQSLRLMIWITSYFAIFIAFTSEWILPIIYGDKYSGAGTVTFLIMFYTVYQAWGQITGAYMLALEKTKMNATVAVIGQLLTLLFVFLFQIPNFIWPEGLGAVGIALNYLVTNIISITISICAISGTLKIPKIRTWGIQIPPILICSILTILLKEMLNFWMPETTSFFFVIKTLFAGVIYTCVIGTIIYICPQFIGVSRERIRYFIKRK